MRVIVQRLKIQLEAVARAGLKKGIPHMEAIFCALKKTLDFFDAVRPKKQVKKVRYVY